VSLSSLEKNKWYIIKNVDSKDEELKYRFFKMGIYPGARIMLKRKAPLFFDPLLVQVELSQFALSKNEAKAIEVGELCQ